MSAPRLKRRRTGHLEDEFIVTAEELAIGWAMMEGRISRDEAVLRLAMLRWTEADAHKYLDVIESDIRARIRHMPVRPEYLAALAAGRVRP